MGEMFIRIDRTARVPLHRQLEESIRRLIDLGKLRGGERVPSTRQLAAQLGLDRMTVQSAYSLLEADGLITTQVGRGTFVSRALPPPVERKTFEPVRSSEALLSLWGPLFNDLRANSITVPAPGPQLDGGVISFVAAAPPADLFPAADFKRCVDFVLKRRLADFAAVGPCDGLPSLKAYLVRWFAQKGMDVAEDEVLVTNGCQEAMDLTKRLLAGPGEAVAIENPTFPGAMAALDSAERLELPVQDGGLDLTALASDRAHTRCKLIYAVPNFHNPTGRLMSLNNREGLVAFAQEKRVPIIEDDVFGDLRYDGLYLPSLKVLCPHLVIYIGSFSKILTPGLRVGWVVAPRPVIRQLTALKQASDLHTNLLAQAALDEFCRRDLLHRHLKRVKRIFARRRDAMAEALRRWFPAEASWTLPQGGLSMWVSLSPEFDTDQLARLAAEEGVQFLPGSLFYFRSPVYNSLRLSFAGQNEERIDRGIHILGTMLQSERASLCHSSLGPLAQPIM